MKKMHTFLKSLLSQETDARYNIGTFTSLHCHALVKEYLPQIQNKSVIDKKAYAAISYFKDLISEFMTETFENENGKAIVTSGSTESILLSLYYAREKAKNEFGISKPNIVLSEAAHYSFFNCAKLLNIEVKQVLLNEELAINVDAVDKAIDANTILLVGILGSTELGVIDDIAALNAIAQEHSIGLHIDAAIGGFLVPFYRNDIRYKFTELDALESVNISGHKFGLSLPGCGVLLMRDKTLTQKYAGKLDYLSSGESTIENLLITQSALGLFSLGINIQEYGRKGYVSFAKNYQKNKKQFTEFLKQNNIAFFSGSDYTPQIYIYPEDVYELSQYLTRKGWIQSPYTAKGMPYAGIRVVIKKGQQSLINKGFVNDLKKFFGENISIPAQTSAYFLAED